MIEMTNKGILFVCLGNICRSPTAEIVTRTAFAEAGLDVPVASCGTGGWHVGQGADPRSMKAAGIAGYDLGKHRARQLEKADFSRFDLLLAMDQSNLADLLAMCPDGLQSRVGLFLQVADAAPPAEVPDPYEGGAEGFRHVIELVERGAHGLVKRLRE